ncbi:FMN reductase [Kitasatospora herbaricolor]|uniref:flavodoxin family protein n=1 Tax=Kitasatospora herbaricolor TaxID=68217 RepID=UPI00174D868F|nr:flavodoxin family protein [Kitasatospora herbaricolor]MDQ0307527.1 multimeric flavodoxin WrbA [Kitasatospora herbaricolor]GGV16876.1 FMN reductase [Kitasatospora herbaricolor]
MTFDHTDREHDAPTVTVTVVHHSVHGHTRVLAEHLADGARLVPGARVHLVEIRPEDVVAGRWHDAEVLALLDRSDAIVLGCPTLMGSVSAVFKAFMEAAFTPFTTQAWKDKLAGGFTMSASQSGDKLAVLQQLSVFAAQLGMQWIGVGDMPGNNWSGGSRDDVNRLGSWLGLMSQSHADQGPQDAGSRGDLLTARRYGERIARLTQRWVNAVPYETGRMTEHEARALSASLRETDPAPVAATGA